MKFSTSILTMLGLAATTLACTASQGCCWNNEDACRNQHKSCKGIAGNFGDCPCDEDSYKADFCKGFDCNGADCCDTTTHWGRSCP
ncbi:hypothetical protein J7T55_014719 [Diaporthe amygdali]|uniref:uncharacterized protein n=1 Tax=Phomopsis amygdali TaxID=1214568 RepID=UPI0022FE13CD|nr:uncharacterized protein J7T55_014719 [Diaporthe amygdali]KAJ0109918.1 hypothetical protein J7T55_014719 [Diaporthe amygdali]